MTAIFTIADEWQAAEARFKQQREEWQAKRAPLAARAAAFDAEKNPKILRKLARAFEKATSMAHVKRKIRQLDTQMRQDEFALRTAAEKQYQALGEIALGMPQASVADAQRYAVIKDIRVHVQGAAAKVASAIDQAKEASGYEVFDMAASNKGISFLSYLKTDSAKDAIRAAGGSIAALNTRLHDAQKQDAQIVTGLGAGNTLDLFFDMAGGFAGAFTSYLNMKKLDEATARMEGIAKTLSAMETETARGMRLLQTVAIRSVQGSAAGMEKLAQSIAPYMPEDTADILQGRKAPPRVDVLHRRG